MNEINLFSFNDFINNSFSLSTLNSAAQHSKKIITAIAMNCFESSLNYYNQFKKNVQFPSCKLNFSFTQSCSKIPDSISTALCHVKKYLHSVKGLKSWYSQMGTPI